jgi:hypothetical protein
MNIPAVLIAAALSASVPPAQAQEKKESAAPPVYKVELNIKDGGDAESQPSLHFSMLIEESRKSVFQATSRGPSGCGSQLVDTGANIELTAHGSDGGKIVLDGSVDLTSVTGQVNLSSLCEPIIGERKLAFRTTVELGKTATLPDEPGALPTRRVEAVVTRVN